MGSSFPDSSGPLHIIPHEARIIAGHFCHVAVEVEGVSASLRAAAHRLGGSWEGASREAFFDVYDRSPAEFGHLADSIRRKAQCIRTIHVVVWPWETGPS
jgi:uncharacterized protein YukE